MNKPTRFYSNKQEKKVAKAVNGRQTSNSGATAFQKGDVLTKDWLIECKTSMSEKKSFSIKEEWLEKNREEAFAMNRRYSALAFNFGPDLPNYYVLSEKVFKTFLELLEIVDAMEGK